MTRGAERRRVHVGRLAPSVLVRRAGCPGGFRNQTEGI